MSTKKKPDTQKLVLLALLTAIVIVLQVLAVALPIFPFTLALVLVPMVIGTALISPLAGGWLGFVFGFVVLVTGNANLFLIYNPAETIIVVLLKGALAGFAAGFIYKLLAGKSKDVATVCAAIICPIVNTGIFIIGAYAFFIPTIMKYKELFGFVGSESATEIIFLGLIGLNFPLELGINIVLCPAIVRLIQYGQKRLKGGAD